MCVTRKKENKKNKDQEGQLVWSTYFVIVRAVDRDNQETGSIFIMENLSGRGMEVLALKE